MKRFFSSPYLKLVIFILALSYLLQVFLRGQEDILGALFTYGSFFRARPLVLPLLLLLMLANWGLEAFKWKLLAGAVEPIGFSRSFRSVLAGLSLGFVSPHAVGDYAARIWILKGPSRVRGIGPIFLGRLVQSVPTFVFGAYALVTFAQLRKEGQTDGLLMGFLLTLLGLLLVYVLWKFAFRSPFVRYIKFYFGLMCVFSKAEIMKLLVLSFLRFFVFSAQFIVLLKIGGIDLPFSVLLAGVGWVFFAKSVLPSFNFLSDLGVREFSAVIFFEQYEVNLSLIVAASLFLWVINILVPALIGLYFIRSFKFKVD